jgi:Ni/Fe-hydrogenase 1 B-type cytochrome subunit
MATTTYRTLGAAPVERNFGRKYVWQLPVRVAHWVNVLAITTLFWTGLYMATPVLSSNGEPYQHFVMGYAREIHFIAGYAMLFAFILRVYWFYVGNNYSRSGFPFVWRAEWWADLKAQTIQYLRLERGHVHLGHNALAGAAYTVFVILLGWCQIITGLCLYAEGNRGGFWDHMVGWIIPILGGSFRVHMWHHTLAWGFVVFGILHLSIVTFDSHQYRNGLITSIISGYKFYEKGDLDHDRWIS